MHFWDFGVSELCRGTGRLQAQWYFLRGPHLRPRTWRKITFGEGRAGGSETGG